MLAFLARPHHGPPGSQAEPDSLAVVAVVAGSWRVVEWMLFHSAAGICVNADKHPAMNRMHAPGKEMRIVVVLPAENWDDGYSAARAVLSLQSFLHRLADISAVRT